MTTIAFAAVSLLAFVQNDKTQANSYDDAWESAWVTHGRTIYNAGTGKSPGMVLHVGDSITFSMAYGSWIRSYPGAGQTTEDQTIILWFGGNASWPSGAWDATNTNGLYLAQKDFGRGMTSAGGLSTDEFLTGMGNGGPNMPGATDQASGRTNVTNASITSNLHVDSVSWAFSNARFAVLMLGTNDMLASVPAATFIANLGTIVDRFEARAVVVILSTIPPLRGLDVTAYNDAVRTLAQTRQLPLIDYYAEVLARQPGTAWDGTLIGTDGIHPTGGNASADPYQTGGDPSTHQTGTNAANDGYLLRTWLTVQKLKEVQSYIVLGNNPPAPGPGPAPAPAPAPASTSSGGGGGGRRCGCSTVASSPAFGLWLAAGLVLLAIRRR